ncbi:MAG: hypothetical protein AAGE98_04305 [Actinomycetota bacterium]
MSDDRWVVLGLAHPRAGWFSELARWSTAAAVPVDFVKCVSADEVRARLTGGRPYSALLVGGDVSGLDRDLVDTTRTAGAAVVVVDPAGNRDWTELGVDSLLPGSFERSDLMSVLTEHAPPISRVAATISDEPDEGDISWRGHLIAVTGSGGVGSSTLAMGLAQALAGDASNAGMVVLADFALNGELAMLHDSREVIPGVQELAEAHRGGRLGSDEVRSMVFDAVGRDYHLLLGLRRQRDWTVIRPRAFEAAIDGLRRSYRHVVADVDVDVEGEAETGSIDVEDRNLIARTTLSQADIVVVAGTGSTKGVHGLTRDLRQLRAHGVPVDRLVPVVNRAPRSPRKRAEIGVALAALLDRADDLDGLVAPLFTPDRRDVEDAIRDGVRLPTAIGHALHGPVTSLLERRGVRNGDDLGAMEPVAVTPGSLGSWTEEDDG